MMNFENYYEKNKTYITFTDVRLGKIIDIVSDLKPKNLLDIGCGNGYLLDQINERNKDASLWGVDVYDIDGKKKWKYKKADITNPLPFKANTFDCLVLGEVIEHVPDPDFLLKECYRVLNKKGTLIISTPNLVSWANRLLVLCGVQPIFTETSTEVNLGRYFKALGQGEKTQGHLKIFTHKSLEELLKREKFKVKEMYGVPFFFPFPLSLLDKFFTNFVSLSSGLLYVCKK
jgi:2-polyprenyl-3-methyl-5-hydroxy-6-metoxy-1,4-benzoquinol methylase